jgi:hypothetical protein
MQLYRNESSDPKYNAQRNLEGRTHYVDDDTLKFHKSRILRTVITDGGLLLAIIESYAVDMHNTSRAFRPVIFDLFGTVIECPKLEDGFKTHKQALDAMWDILNDLDAVKVTMDGLDTATRNHNAEIANIRRDLEKVKAFQKSA